METLNSNPVVFKEERKDNQSTYTWVKDGEELARVLATQISSYYPKIEFNFREDIVPYYEEDNKTALDEIGEMSMYKDMEVTTADGRISGTMTCSHNASLGIDSFVQSVKGWISKSQAK